MEPKTIKPCGKVKKEPQVRAKERKTIAYEMSTQGTNCTAEYIEMIDTLARKELLKDAVAYAIHLAVSKQIENSKSLSYDDFTSLLKQSAEKVFSGTLYREGFDFRNSNNKISFSVDFNKPCLDKTYVWPNDIKVDKKQIAQINQIFSQMEADEKAKNELVESEIDRALWHIKVEMLNALGIKTEDTEFKKSVFPTQEINLDKPTKKVSKKSKGE